MLGIVLYQVCLYCLKQYSKLCADCWPISEGPTIVHLKEGRYFYLQRLKENYSPANAQNGLCNKMYVVKWSMIELKKVGAINTKLQNRPFKTKYPYSFEEITIYYCFLNLVRILKMFARNIYLQ